MLFAGDGPARFLAGKEFRTFKEFDISSPAGTQYVIKAVVPINIILSGLEVSLDNGFLKIETIVGGSESGVFSALPIFPRNNMSTRPLPFYLPQVVLTEGGSHSGGTVIDVIRLKAENTSGAAASVGSAPGDERGVAANTYYLRFTNLAQTGDTEGVFKARWRELP